MTSSEIRHAWLETARVRCSQLLAEAGYEAPETTRITIGFAFASRRALGQCWSYKASTDGHYEIMISPVVRDSISLMATIIHELIHAAVGIEHGHKAPFRKAALAVGLVGPMRSTKAGDALVVRLRAVVEEIGAYPAGAVSTAARPTKVQPTRMLKVVCPECGFTVRMTQKWMTEVGLPLCPEHGPMYRQS